MRGLGNVHALNGENRMKSEGENRFLPFISSLVFYHPKTTGYRTKQLPLEVVSAAVRLRYRPTKGGVCLKFAMTNLRVALKHKSGCN